MTKLSRIWLILSLTLLMVMAMESCRKYDYDQFREIVQKNYLVDTVDQQQDWNLLKERALRIKVQVDDPDITNVQVLDGNPFETEGVEILANRFCSDSSTLDRS